MPVTDIENESAVSKMANQYSTIHSEYGKRILQQQYDIEFVCDPLQISNFLNRLQLPIYLSHFKFANLQ